MIWILYDLFICILYRILFFIYMYNMSHHSMCTFDHNLKISKSSLKIFVPIYHFYLNELKRRKKNRGKSVISPINFQFQRLLHDANEQLYAIISLYVYLYIQLNKHNWFQQILMYIFFTLTVFNRIIKQYILECFNVVTIFLVELFWRCQKLMVLMSCERLNSHAYWKLSPG